MYLQFERVGKVHSAAGNIPYGSLFTLLFILIHIPLALLMRQASEIATLHALLVLLIGLYWAVNRQFYRVSYVAAYIVGAEVLWRMNGAGVFWEYGKYATVVLLVVALARMQRLFYLPTLAFFYFILLLPSIILTVSNVDLAEARDQLSFNLSGPLALLVTVWFFSNLQLSTRRLQRLFLALVAPIAGIVALAVYRTLTTSTQLVFYRGLSNFATSGGFGPNQVSAVLGLGILIIFLYLIGTRTNPVIKTLLFAGMLVFAAQSALTFSRGGLVLAAGSMGLASWFLLRDTRARLKLLAVVAIVLLITRFAIWPYLDELTDGEIGARFRNQDSNGRVELIWGELETWQAYPLFGIGPGRSIYHRITLGYERSRASHMEFTRMVAEHGLFGFIAILLIVALAWQNLRRAPTTRSKALVAAFIGWAFLSMSHNAFRLAAPAFLLGLSSATFVQEDDTVDGEGSPHPPWPPFPKEGGKL